MKKTIFLLLAGPLTLSSCLVSKQKFDMAEQGRLAALYSRDSLSQLLASSRQEAANLGIVRDVLMQDTMRLGKSLRSYQGLLANSTRENERLNAQLSDKQKTILSLEQMVTDQNNRVKALLDNVKNVLNGFTSDELTVREEGGKVYVAMSDKLLFESGSANVNAQGKEALGLLSQVLNKQTDVDVFIEGHTDSIPIHTAVFRDNWDLSVIRATSVVRILTQSYGVNALQVQPSGRGEYKPVSPNTTAEGRARNRRTEIIIAPKLDKLYELINSTK